MRRITDDSHFVKDQFCKASFPIDRIFKVAVTELVTATLKTLELTFGKTILSVGSSEFYDSNSLNRPTFLKICAGYDSGKCASIAA